MIQINTKKSFNATDERIDLVAIKDGMVTPIDFSHFKKAYQVLSDKLHPKVYELEFFR